MKYIIENKKKTPIFTKDEVIIVGGGVAGFVAAIAAKRNGANVTLIEKTFQIGGTILNGPLEAIMTFHDEENQIIKGIPEELIEKMVDKGGALGHIKDDVGYCKTITPVDPEIMKLVTFEMLEEEGVSILLDTLVVDTVKKKNKIEAVIVENKSGRKAIEGDIFIDCSGDGDLCALARAEYMKGRNNDNLMQPLTLLFKVGDVNKNRLINYVKKNKEQFKLVSSFEELKNRDVIHLWGFSKILKEGYKNNKLLLKRNEVQMATTIRGDGVIINYTRVKGDGTDVNDITNSQITATKQAHELLNLFKNNVPGFENSYIMYTGQIGVRETRRIKGKYILTEEDIINGVEFEDVVARGAFPIDIHQPDNDSLEYKKINKAYDIPYRCLIASNIENLFMAGRCISVTHKALASTRISATCMGIGQAAGVAAAVCINQNKKPQTIDVSNLQSILRENNLL